MDQPKPGPRQARLVEHQPGRLRHRHLRRLPLPRRLAHPQPVARPDRPGRSRENVNDQALIEWFLGHGVLVWTGDFSLLTDSAELARRREPDEQRLAHPAWRDHGAGDRALRRRRLLRAAGRAQPRCHGGRLVPAARPWPQAQPERGNRGWAVRRLRPWHDLAVQQPPAHDGAVAGAADRLVRHPADPGHDCPRHRVDLTRSERAGLRPGVPRRGGALPHRPHPGPVRAGVLRDPVAMGQGRRATSSWPAWGSRRSSAVSRSPTRSGSSSLVPSTRRTHRSPPTTSSPTSRAIVVFSPLSIAGSEDAGRLASSHAELNTYLGLPLLRGPARVPGLVCVVQPWSSPPAPPASS